MITEEEIRTALSIIREAVEELPNLEGAAEDAIIPPSERNVTINVDL